jgi:hypothetical protein
LPEAEAAAAAELGIEKLTVSPAAMRLPLQVDSPAISALPTSHQWSRPPVVAGLGLGFSAAGFDCAGVLGCGIDSVVGLTGGGDRNGMGGGGDGDGVGSGGDGDGQGGGGGSLWWKSRRMLMAFVGSSPAMWSARMMSICGVSTPSTARTVATCSSLPLPFPISPRLGLLAESPRK